MAVNKKAQKQPTIIRRVNIFFGRMSRKEVSTFLVFVLISIFFWMVRTAYEENATMVEVPFVVEHLPQDIVFTTHIPSHLKVTITDNNLQLIRYGKPKNLTVDFERYADATGNIRISAAELQSLLRMQLKTSTKITAMSPSLIDARYARTAGRRLPVRLHADYLPRANYRVHSQQVSPDSVLVHAPDVVLDTMQYVYTQYCHHYNLTDTLTDTLQLVLPLGVKATPASVVATIPVAQYVEKVFELMPIQTVDVPRGTQLTVFPYAARVSCNVDFNAYQYLTSEAFVLTVSYDSIYTPDQRYLPINVQYLGVDNGLVTNVKASPAQVEYIIEQ